MPGGRNPWATTDDYLGFSLLAIAFGGIFGGVLAWSNWHEEIAWGAAQLLHQEIAAVRFCTAGKLDHLDALVMTADYGSVKPREILAVFDAFGRVIRTPVALGMAALSIPCFMFAAPSRFTRKFDLDGLIRELAPHFPVASAYASRRLALVAPASDVVRPCDPALQPQEWRKRFALDDKGKFSMHRARIAFCRQLGTAWTGLDHASPQGRVLIAAFSLHLLGKRADAFALLGDFASALGDRPERSEAGPTQSLEMPEDVVVMADRLLEDAKLIEPALAILSRHGFLATGLMSLLTQARKRGGVLPPAAFNGLKLVDRSLWYALHGLGFPGDMPGTDVHPNPRIEAAGVFAHWLAECRAGEALLLPEIDAALAVCAS